MSLLRVLHLAGVLSRAISHELCAVKLLGLGTSRLDAGIGQRGGVRTHISNVSVFIQTLRDAHGALRGKAQLATGLLLQGGRHERWVRAAGVGLFFDASNPHRGSHQAICQMFCPGFIQHDRAAFELARIIEIAALGHLFPIDGGELGAETIRLAIRRVHFCCQIPVFGGDERHALALALHDHAGGHGLHASGGQARHDLLPQHGRNLIAVEAVQHTAGFLGIHEVIVQLAGIFRGSQDGGLGDLVEHHAAHRHLRLEYLQQVPGDGLALAVGVCCEVELIYFFELGLEIRDLLLLVRADHVQRCETFIHVHAKTSPWLLLVLGRHVRSPPRKIPNMAHRSFNDVIRTQIRSDLSRFCRRLYDH